MNIINNQPMQERTGPEGQEIFTQIFTALLPREHHEHQEGAALLPVDETSAREDGPPACLFQRQPDELPTTPLPPLPETTAIPNLASNTCPTKAADYGKCKITVISAVPIQPVNAGHRILEFHDSKDFWNIGLGEMLIRLGQKLIQGNQRDEWLSMVQIASLCRRYHLKWQGGSTRATKLEQVTKDYFDKHGDISGGGVQVEYKTEFNEDKRRDDLFLNFRKVYGDGLCN